MVFKAGGLLRIIIVITFIALWEILPSTGIVNEFSVPRFSRVLIRVIDLLNPDTSASIVPLGFYAHLQVTLLEIGLAFLITVFVAIPVGFLIGGFKPLTQIYEPLIYLIYAFPSVSLYPLIVIIWGFGLQSKIVFGAFLGIFPLILNTVAALRGIRPSYIQVAHLFGCKTIQLLIKVIIPASITFILSGTRLALAFNIIGVLFAEIVASSIGLGFLITYATYKLDVITEYAAIIISLTITYFMLETINFVQKWVFRRED